MKLISREELKDKLDKGDDFKLVMTWKNWAFCLKRIPGSINIFATDVTKGAFKPKDEIVVYCAAPACPASVVAYQRLIASGYQNARRYAGGIIDWEEAGYPLEGESGIRQNLSLVSP